MCLSLHSLQKKKAVDCFWRIFFLTILVVLAQEKSRLQYFPEAGTLRKGSAHQVSTNTPSPAHTIPDPAPVLLLFPRFLPIFTSSISVVARYVDESAVLGTWNFQNLGTLNWTRKDYNLKPGYSKTLVTSNFERERGSIRELRAMQLPISMAIQLLKLL